MRVVRIIRFCIFGCPIRRDTAFHVGVLYILCQRLLLLVNIIPAATLAKYLQVALMK